MRWGAGDPWDPGPAPSPVPPALHLFQLPCSSAQSPFPARIPPHPPQLAEAEKQLKQLRFAEALRSPDDDKAVSDGIVLADIAIDASYDGPHLPSACVLWWGGGWH